MVFYVLNCFLLCICVISLLSGVFRLKSHYRFHYRFELSFTLKRRFPIRQPKLRKKKVGKHKYWYTEANGGAYFGRVKDVPYKDAKEHFDDHVREKQAPIPADALTVGEMFDKFLAWVNENRAEQKYRRRRRDCSRFGRFTADKDDPIDTSAIRIKRESWPKCHLEPMGGSFRVYEPFRTTCLFRLFADTEIKPDAILAFANKYGPLGAAPAEFGPDEFDAYDESDNSEFGQARQPKQVVSREENASLLVRQFDSLPLWVRSIKEMRKCIRGLEATGGTAERTKVVQRTIEFINMRLLHKDVRVSFVESSGATGLIRMYPKPASLLTALWIQLGEYVSENRSWKQCPVCNKWFGIGGSDGDSRRSRTYCEDACKSQAYRNRKRQL